MIVIFDASILVYLFDKVASAPLDPSTKMQVTDCHDRVRHLLAKLAKAGDTVVIPAPSLAEVLVKAQAKAEERLKILSSNKNVRIVAFDQRAAVEHAARWAATRVGKRHGAGERTKAKFDEQIMAIAVVTGATTIYSDDPDFDDLVGKGMQLVKIHELPLPPETAQKSLNLHPQDSEQPAT